METLTEMSSRLNFATPEAARLSLSYAQRFTACFREVESLPASLREAAMLDIQFPHALLPPQQDDVFTGRILYPCVGISPEACGLGWYFDFNSVNALIDSGNISDTDIQKWKSLVEFWKPRVTQAKVRSRYPAELAAILPRDDWYEASGVGFPLYRMAGTVLDYGKLLTLGLDGMESSVQSLEDTPFKEGSLQALQTVRKCIDWYASGESLQLEQRDVLLAIRHAPPSNFREAVQLFWLWALLSGSWNYGRLDMVLGPYLERDLDSGLINEEEALTQLCSLWRLIAAYSNQYNNRVFIGGKGRPDEGAADRFALLAIEATRRVRLNQPQLSLRFYKGQNPLLWERAIDAIAEGCTFPMLYNDDVNIPAVANAFAVSTEMAKNYTPFGCGEYVLGTYSVGTPSGVINLLKALEVALHEGHDPKTGKKLVDGIPPASAIATFEDLWLAYTKVLNQFIEALALQQKIEYDVTGEETSFLLISLLTNDCMEKNQALLQGGVRYLGGTLETYGNSNTADSLHVIDELVFRRREISLPDLVAALDANFESSPDLRKRCQAISKYGNDEATSDAMAERVHTHVCSTTRNQAAKVGLHSYLVVIINNWANVLLGNCVGASAEGRLSGQPMANGNNPTPGSDISGPTAFLNSLAKLDPALHAGAVQNMKFSKEWFGDMRPKFDALLRTYFLNGGSQAMITVVSRDDMQSAMREPEKWGSLMVRVGGFSIRFVDLPRESQLELLARTLH